MKKKYTFAAAAVCVCVGIWRCFELIFNTDSVTGFTKSGSLVLRYIILALPVAAAAVFSLCFKPRKHGASDLQLVIIAYAAAAVGAAANGVASVFMLTAEKISAVGAAIDLAAAVGAVWLLIEAQRRRFSFPAAVLLTTAFIGTGVYAFIISISSVYRIAPVTELCACLFSALFSVYMLKALAVSNKEKRTGRMLYFSGLLTFYACCCLFLPQQVWGLFNASAQPYMAAKTMLLAPYGFLGLISALYAEEITAFGAEKNERHTETENGDEQETTPADTAAAE